MLAVVGEEDIMPITPLERPRLSSTELRARIAQHEIDRSKCPVVVGIQGY
jgi:hypothetical protein